MLYDRRDFGLLRLAGAYQWLPLASLRALSPLKQLYQEAELLSLMGLLTFSRSNEYLMPSPKGYQFLHTFELDYQPPTKRPYTNSPTLRHRLEIGSILFTWINWRSTARKPMRRSTSPMRLCPSSTRCV